LWFLSIVFIIDVLFVLLFYKELKISSFDPGLAATLGFNVSLIHYLFMGAVSLTTVAAFESVGAILVVAMLIVPGATAYLWTDRLSHLLVLSVVFGLLAAVIGYVLATFWDSSIAGAITVAAGFLFLISILGSHRYGLLSRLLNQFQLGVKYASDHLLLTLYRAQEKQKKEALIINDIYQTLSTSRFQAALAIRQNKKKGAVHQSDHFLQLTKIGQEAARSLIQGHRLWENFVDRELGLPADHWHESANRVEHFIDETIKEELQKKFEE
jgi:manganese/zinc/iron transport system permease protein